MVKNRKELLEVAGSNANQLKAHLRRTVSGFINSQQISPEELAYVLGITGDEMMQILEGDGNITVDTLSKLLVATDLAVEIKPIRNTPLGAYGRNMPRGGAYPGPNGIPVDENGQPLPPPPGFIPGMRMPGDFMPQMPRKEERAANMVESPMTTSEPPRDARGRFTRKNVANMRAAAPRPSATRQENQYLNVSDAELVNIIRQNIWDGEIDIEHANHEQLAAFVAMKERVMRERAEGGKNDAPKKRETPVAPAVGGSDVVNDFLAMLRNVAREAQNNPQLIETISRFMPRRG